MNPKGLWDQEAEAEIENEKLQATAAALATQLAVAVRSEEMALAIPEAYAKEGMEDIGREDLVIPRARVIQPTSKLDGRPGQFHLNLTNECRDQIKAVLLKVTKSRVCWNADDLAAPPECASDDTIQPRPDYAGRYATACADCPMAAWGNDNEPPACRLTYNFLAADMNNEDMPFMLSLSGASVKQARKVITAFYVKRRPLYSQPVMITSVEVKNDKGRFYEVVLAPNGSGKTFDWQPYRAMYQAYQSVTLSADTEQTVNPAKARDGEPADLAENDIPF